jgi:hypothetical protein
MKKDYITKTLGGLTIMFSIFLFFAAAKQLTYQNKQILANITSGTKNPSPIVKEIDDRIISGNFNTESNGNVRYSYDENSNIKFSYKAIKSDKLKNKNISPVLKLEIEDSGNKIWKETKWSWIDYNQGILYFHFQTEKDGTNETEANFTGKYQIILND